MPAPGGRQSAVSRAHAQAGPSGAPRAQVMGHKRLLETNADIILQQKINLRAPYVTPLNVLQARGPGGRGGLQPAVCAEPGTEPGYGAPACMRLHS